MSFGFLSFTLLMICLHLMIRGIWVWKFMFEGTALIYNCYIMRWRKQIKCDLIESETDPELTQTWSTMLQLSIKNYAGILLPPNQADKVSKYFWFISNLSACSQISQKCKKNVQLRRVFLTDFFKTLIRLDVPNTDLAFAWESENMNDI